MLVTMLIMKMTLFIRDMDKILTICSSCIFDITLIA
jgi:hypothetical protein